MIQGIFVLVIFGVATSVHGAPQGYAAPTQEVQVGRSGSDATDAVTQVEVIPVDSSRRQLPTTARLLPFPDARLFQQVVQTVPAVQQIVRQPVRQIAVRQQPVATTRLVAAPAVVQPAPRLAPADAKAQYRFGYSVADTKTGDSKTRQESREGDVVTGSYSVADPDGRIRKVTYTADAVNGFQAQVTYDGEQGPPAIAIDAPQTAEIISTRTSGVLSFGSDDLDSVPTIHTVRGATVAAAPQTVLRNNAVNTVQEPTVVIPQRSNAILQPTVVRAAVPQTTVVRNDVHAIHHHTEPATLRTLPTLVRTAAASPAVHTVHHTRTHPTSVISPGQLFHLGSGQFGTIQVIGLDSFNTAGATVIDA